MPEQDTRGFALMTDAPMLEPSSVEEAYRFTQTAFELSEAIGGLVFLRLTTAVALTHAIVDVAPGEAPVGGSDVGESGGPVLERNIARYTKAGAAICLNQHQALLVRLAEARRFLHERKLHRLNLGKKGALGIAVVGAPAAYLDEALSAAGLTQDEVSVLRAASTVPFPTEEVGELFAHCESILVLEELEPHFERQLLIDARRVGFTGRIIGKLDGTLSRSGEYGVAELVRGVSAAVGASPAALHLTGEPSGVSGSATVLPSTDLAGGMDASRGASAEPAPRPITVCSGCPHRGTYMAIEAAIKQAGYKKDEVMVTGDIGCTILGMNPPFDLLWNEVSMGSSVSLAQGYVHAGMKTPVIATIGDSTFFHGGIPGVLNAVQHRVPLVVVVMDNGWTGMTGMQVNPGTAETEQKGGRRIDLAQLIPALGVDRFAIADPYDLAGTTAILTEFLREPTGVRVLLARRECAIQARRRGVTAGVIRLDAAKCVFCKQCLRVTGCPALGCSAAGSAAKERITVDPSLCNGCGLCVAVCPTQALGRSQDGSQGLGEKPRSDGFSRDRKGAA
jgi:indolepyruvate ferredoxin oxidoreductase alpha subunit